MPGGDWSDLLAALRSAVVRVASVIRASTDAIQAQAPKPKAETSRFGDYEKIEEAKYHSPAAPPSLADSGDLPQSYGRPNVRLLVVDPYLVHVYWDFDPAKLPPHTTSALLRFYDATGGPVTSRFDVEVDLRTRNWYVHLWSPARTYHADLGVRTAGGEFIPLLRSNTVQTPRAWPAAAAEDRVMQAGNSTGHIDAGVPHSPERSDLPVSAAVPKPVAVSAQQQPPLTPPLPRLGSAAEILQQRLAEIYALRRWQAPAATSAAERGATLLPTTQPDAGNDLTAFAEKQFSPGFSSLLPGSHGPKPSGA